MINIEQTREYLSRNVRAPASSEVEMRVIRHESGWDIALDMVFTDKKTAETIARRIQHAVQALIRDAVDASMCGNKPAADEREITSAGTDWASTD